MWYIVLGGEQPNGTTPFSNLVALLTLDGHEGYFFRWLLVAPLCCAAMAASYLSPIARRQFGLTCLVILGIVLSVASLLTFDFKLTIFVVAPVPLGCYAFKSLRETSPSAADTRMARPRDR